MGEETAAQRDADDERPPRDAERQGASGPGNAAPAGGTVEESGRESFPASDPPATWSGPDIVPEPTGEADDRRPGRATDAPGSAEVADDRCAPEEARTEGGSASP